MNNMNVHVVDFDNSFAKSEAFKRMFREGMSLVEESAQYLEGKGKLEAKHLSRPISLLYATESMRLTTRLMQITSWLLVIRAVTDNEITIEKAIEEKGGINLEKDKTLKKVENFGQLPLILQDLISRAIELYLKIKHIDHMMSSPKNVEVDQKINPVNDQLKFLENALSQEN